VGARNAYSGNTTVDQGTLQLAGGSDRLPTHTLLSLGNFNRGGPGGLAARFDLNNNDQTIRGLQSLGGVAASPGKAEVFPNVTVTNSGDTMKTLTINLPKETADGYFGGSITGNLALVKTGTGTEILYGVNNSYKGGTTITGGTLQVAADGSMGDAKIGVTIDGGTLKAFDGNRVVTGRAITLGAKGGTLEDRFTVDGVISGAGGLTKAGDGFLILGGSAPNTYAGKTTVNAGTASILVVAKDKALGDRPKGTTVNDGAALGFRNVNYTVAEPVTISGAGPKLKSVGKNVGAIYNMEGKNSFAGPVTLAAASTIGAAPKTSLTFTSAVDKAGNKLTEDPGAGARLIFQGGIVDSKGARGDAGGMVIDGALTGKVLLAAPGTYAGPTQVKSGILEVDNSSGSGTGSGPVTVAPAGTLSGVGTVAGPVSVEGGHLHPGADGPGILKTLGGVALAPGSSFDVELAGPDPSSSFYSQLQVLGGTRLGGSMLDLLLAAPPVAGAEFDILRNLDDQPIDGVFAGLGEGALFDVTSPLGTFTFQITYHGGDDIYHDGSHNDVVLTDIGGVTTGLAAVPEPRSLVTFGIGAAVLGLLAIRRARQYRRAAAGA
jgi:autotransporter-associated beta strand protein